MVINNVLRSAISYKVYPWKGNYFNNVMAENFFGIMKTKFLYAEKPNQRKLS